MKIDEELAIWAMRALLTNNLKYLKRSMEQFNGEPPLLNDEEINRVFGQDMSAIGDWMIDCRMVAKAQRQSDMKFYDRTTV